MSIIVDSFSLTLRCYSAGLQKLLLERRCTGRCNTTTRCKGMCAWCELTDAIGFSSQLTGGNTDAGETEPLPSFLFFSSFSRFVSAAFAQNRYLSLVHTHSSNGPYVWLQNTRLYWVFIQVQKSLEKASNGTDQVLGTVRISVLLKLHIGHPNNHPLTPGWNIGPLKVT